MENIFQTYIFSQKMGNYIALSGNLQQIALNAIKIPIEDKYLNASKKQLNQISFAFLKYVDNQLNHLSDNCTEEFCLPHHQMYAFFGEHKIELDKRDKKRRELLKASSSFYFINAAKSYSDVKIYFAAEAGEECPEVRQILTQPIQKQVDIAKISTLKTNLFSFIPATEYIEREDKYQPITYQILGFTETYQVLLDQKYGYVHLSLDINSAEKISDLIFVNTSAKKFFQTLEKIKQFAQKIEHKSDLLEKAKCFLQLKKEIWLIDKTIGIITEPSLWKDIFFPELDDFYTQLLEKHLEQRKEKQNITIKSAPHIRLSQPLIF